ncbi:MAG TPA: cytochrome ubiquinol oxidase subunit I, partial [Hyphomicrobiaceae bacterium]
IGFLMALMGVWAAWMRWKGRLFDSPALLRSAVIMGPSGFIAVLAGWIVTEVGRQPYTVYGLLRTADSASPIATTGVAASLIAFFVVYMVVFGAGTVYMFRLAGRRPEPTEPEVPHVPIRTAGITPAPALTEKGFEEDEQEPARTQGGGRGD